MSRTDFEAAYIERYGHRPRGWNDDFQVYQSERLPKKGEDVQVWCYDTKEQFVAFSLGDGRFQFGIGQDGIILACRPTHWQPLPKAPYQPGYDFSDSQLEGV